jgi:hypothetical protein
MYNGSEIFHGIYEAPVLSGEKCISDIGYHYFFSLDVGVFRRLAMFLAKTAFRLP